MSERVAIYGCWNLPEHIRQQVRDRVKALKPGDTLITSGDPGTAYEARAAARDMSRHHLNLVEIPADWSTHGTMALMVQAGEILGACDRAVIFWDGVNPRVRDFIDFASSVPHEVVAYVAEGALK